MAKFYILNIFYAGVLLFNREMSRKNVRGYRTCDAFLCTTHKLLEFEECFVLRGDHHQNKINFKALVKFSFIKLIPCLLYDK